MNLRKIEDQEAWLKEQGARIQNRRPLRRAFFLPPKTFSEDVFAEPSVVEDVVYQLEVTGTMVHRWMQFQSRLMDIIDHAHRHNSFPTESYAELRRRHEHMLEENPMYQQAWREFQEIRALLGESTYWP